MLANLGRATVSRRRMQPAAVALALLTASVVTAQVPVIGPQVRIDVGGGTFAANETTASASEMDPNVIVAAWNDWRDAAPKEGDIVRMGVARSFDGGQTWEDLLVRPPNGFQRDVEGDPMTAYDDRTGTLWVGAIAFSDVVFVARLDPGETEFEIPVITFQQNGVDKGWMAAGPRMGEPDSTRVYLTLSYGIQWSDDMGDTWTGFHPLGNGVGFLPRVGPNGEMYVVHNTKLRRSLNNGQSFTTHTIAVPMDEWNLADGSRFPGRFRVPQLWYFDVSQQTGNLYAMYMDTTNIVNGQRNVDLYFTKSTDQGTTWTTPVVINGDNDPPGDQFFPWIELDEADRIHVVFLDSRHTVQNDDVINGMFDVYYTYSDDDGTTWNEFRLTPNSWNSADDAFDYPFNLQFLGDYLGMAVAGNRVYPMYIDTTGGDPNIYTNVIVFPNDGDLNGDGVVGAADLLILLVSWGPCADCDDCIADIDGDCSVGA
ncbi:MAG: sialidase family protein, partial [Phycisphaerales bacterium]